jgi:hypothetical protein
MTKEIVPLFLPAVNAGEAEKAIMILIYPDKTGATLVEKDSKPLTDAQKVYTILQVCATIGLKPNRLVKLIKKGDIDIGMFNQRTAVFLPKNEEVTKRKHQSFRK